MFPIPAHIRLCQSRCALFLGTLIVGQILCTAHAAGTPDADTFAGDWKYQQTCGYQHSATVTLTQAGDEVTGEWSDGSRLNGSEGSLKGHVRDGKLYVRFCGADEHAKYPVCPAYQTEEHAYFVRQGSDLGWYHYRPDRVEENTSESNRQYVVLHPVIKGQRLPVDDQCSDDDG